jgi:hypothetical protein
MLGAVKWTATGVLILGTFLNAGLPELYPLGPIVLILGGVIWLGAAVRMADRPLIVTNLVMSSVGLLGLLYQYFGN